MIPWILFILYICTVPVLFMLGLHMFLDYEQFSYVQEIPFRSVMMILFMAVMWPYVILLFLLEYVIYETCEKFL